MKKIIILCLVLSSLFLLACNNEAADFEIDDNYGTFYEIFVASFYDSDGDQTGDLQGIVEKIDYLDETLNVDGLWLMPIMPSPSYHKYDVTDYYAIDAKYGNLEDFANLMTETDERDIKVIIDFVVNHSSKDHPWFLSATKSLAIEPCGEATCSHENLCSQHNPLIDYYTFTKEKGLSDYHKVPGAEAYSYEGRFGNHMPDLNLDNEAVRKEILSIAKYWIDLGVDGFRLDAVTHFYEGNSAKNVEFLSWLQESLVAYKENVYVVAEAWSDGGTILKLHESHINSLFNFPFSNSTGEIIPSIKMKKGIDLAQTMEKWQSDLKEANPKGIDAVFLSNHDNSRSGGALNRDVTLQKMGANVYLLMPGNSFIYYGEELGMVGSGKDENKRQPFVWSREDTTGMTNPPTGSDQFDQPIDSFEVQSDLVDSLLNHYGRLTKIRKKYPEISRGDLKAIDLANDGLCAYGLSWTYEDKTRQVLIIHNFTNETVTVDSDMISAYKVSEVLNCQDYEILHLEDANSIPAMTSIIYTTKE